MTPTKIAAAGFAACAILFAAPALAQLKPITTGADHPLVGRFEGSEIVGYDAKPYDARTFVISGKTGYAPAPTDLQEFEGKSTLIAYQGPEGRTSLELFRNYQTYIKGKGLEPVFECADAGSQKTCPQATPIIRAVFPLPSSVIDNGVCWTNGRYGLYRRGAEVTIAVHVLECRNAKFSPRTLISVVESATLDTTQVKDVPTPKDIRQAFATDGRIALYGVYFDTGKSDPKAESKPTLDAIAQLLAAEPKLNLIVAGHTDSVGGFDANIALSKQRAEAVVKALTTAPYNIAAARLTAFGAGMTAPRAPNVDEAGKAKNRRVELIPR